MESESCMIVNVSLQPACNWHTFYLWVQSNLTILLALWHVCFHSIYEHLVWCDWSEGTWINRTLLLQVSCLCYNSGCLICPKCVRMRFLKSSLYKLNNWNESMCIRHQRRANGQGRCPLCTSVYHQQVSIVVFSLCLWYNFIIAKVPNPPCYQYISPSQHTPYICTFYKKQKIIR